MWNLKNKTNKCILQDRNILRYREQTMFTSGESSEQRDMIGNGIKRYELVGIK